MINPRGCESARVFLSSEKNEGGNEWQVAIAGGWDSLLLSLIRLHC